MVAKMYGENHWVEHVFEIALLNGEVVYHSWFSKEVGEPSLTSDEEHQRYKEHLQQLRLLGLKVRSTEVMKTNWGGQDE